MVRDRRVTLRCLTDDLVDGWDDVDQHRRIRVLRSTVARCLIEEVRESKVAEELRKLPAISLLQHPLIRHFDGSFGPDYDSGSKESISGLSAPHWWKQKTTRWRGAATDHSAGGPDMVWLCAAGIRRAGDTDDFYQAFMRDVKRIGPQAFLPADEDYLLQKIDEKILALDIWKAKVHCAILALLGEARSSAGETHVMQFSAPSRKPSNRAIGELALSVEAIDVDGEEMCEVFLSAKILDRDQIQSVDVAVQIARAALQSDAESWHSTTFTDDAYAFSAIIDPDALVLAEELRVTGRVPERSQPAGLRLGLRAHYARKHGLVHAQVEGSSVLSLCGYWFVPTQDHTNLETCAECARRHEQLGIG